MSQKILFNVFDLLLQKLEDSSLDQINMTKFQIEHDLSRCYYQISQFNFLIF